MNVTLPPPPALNFFAGLFAGAGINMVTSIATGLSESTSKTAIVVDSLLWLLSAATLTWAAQVIEHEERDADLYIDRDFTEREKRDIREQYRRRAFHKARIPFVLTGLTLVLSALLIPGFLLW